jgi:hypothetical protein
MTLLILGLDGLDAGLVEHWDIDSFRLSQSREIETFSYGHKRPYTLEVWPTIATGLHPKQHGIIKGDTSNWENPILDFLSQFTDILPNNLQSKLGSYFDSATGSNFALATTSAETFFDGPQRVVQNWPGVTAGQELVDVWNMTKAGYSNNEFEREVFGKAAGQFGWAEEMLRHDPVLAGVHIHALDVFGHAYTAEQEGFTKSTGRIRDLERTYREIGQRIRQIEESMSEEDNLVVLSDHGMRNEIIDQADMDFGVHSYRAFAATTVDDPLPETVFGVYDWVEKHVEEGEAEEAMQMPKQQLRELGYIE